MSAIPLWTSPEVAKLSVTGPIYADHGSQVYAEIVQAYAKAAQSQVGPAYLVGTGGAMHPEQALVIEMAQYAAECYKASTTPKGETP